MRRIATFIHPFASLVIGLAFGIARSSSASNEPSAEAISASAGSITSPLFVVGFLGEPLTYQIKADRPVISYDASNLPRGLTLERATGLISGTPSLSSGSFAKIIAHTVDGDASATVDVAVVLPLPNADPAIAAIPIPRVGWEVADPIRSRLYVGTQDSIFIVDSARQEVLKTISSGIVVKLALSRDNHTLWIVSTTTAFTLRRLNLDQPDSIIDVPLADRISSVAEGLGNRLYCTSEGGGDALQVDAATGTVQARFHPPSDFRQLRTSVAAISPDGTTLYLADTGVIGDSLVRYGALSRYDITGPEPVFRERVRMPEQGALYTGVSPKGDRVFVVLANLDGFPTNKPHPVLCLSAQNLGALLGVHNVYGSAGLPIFTADGATAYLPIVRSNGGAYITALIDVFDTTTLQALRSIVVGSLQGSVTLSTIAVDHTDKYLYVPTNTSSSPDAPVLIFDATVERPPSPRIATKSLINISTRLRAETGDDVPIGGFIIEGQQPKKVMVRAIGPSLGLYGVSDTLADPTIELHASDRSFVQTNDNWNEHRADFLRTNLWPTSEYESALIVSLEPGAYTAILRGFAETTGVALIEVLDMEPESSSRITNLSTRGKVTTGDNVMIGGFIIGGDQPTRVIVRAVGPSLTQFGVGGALGDTTLDLFDGAGNKLASNDNWATDQAQEIVDSGHPPTDPREAAIVRTLVPGSYTAIVRGANNTTGVALVEIYNLEPAAN